MKSSEFSIKVNNSLLLYLNHQLATEYCWNLDNLTLISIHNSQCYPITIFLIKLQIYQVTNRIHFGLEISSYTSYRLPENLMNLLKYTARWQQLFFSMKKKKTEEKTASILMYWWMFVFFEFSSAQMVCVCVSCVFIYLITFVFIETLTNCERQSIL